MSGGPLLACRDLVVSYDGRRAVDRVSLELATGASVAVVGESGCGKSTLVRALLRLVDPASGDILLDGGTLWSGSRAGTSALHRELRRRVQYVPQDPVSSLNPRLTVEETVAEGALIHGLATTATRREVARDVLERVELGEEHLDRRPHQLSGGQRQRVAIARALAVRPELLILDEPTSALDVEVQGRVLRLLRRLREGAGLGWMFVSHDLAVVRDLCEETVVMQDGLVVERAATEALFREPGHPHTRTLLRAAGFTSGGD